MRNACRSLLLLFCVVAVLLVSPASAGAAEGRPPSQFVYKATPERELAIRLSYPAGWRKEDRRAVLIFFYNGGWNASGASRQFDEQAAYFAQRGMVVAQADYR